MSSSNPSTPNYRDNPTYFDFPESAGGSSSPTGAASAVPPQSSLDTDYLIRSGQALQSLQQVAQSVVEKTGVHPPGSRPAKKRKRKSFREFVSNSLGRGGRKTKRAKEGSADSSRSSRKERTYSEGATAAASKGASNGGTGNDDDYEQQLARMVRSASLEPPGVTAHKSQSLPPQGGPDFQHFYYNCQSGAGGAPPAPPERNHSIEPQQRPKPEIQSATHRSMSMSSSHGRERATAAKEHAQKKTAVPPLAIPQYALHRACRRAELGCDEEPPPDVVVLYSGRCVVSRDWCEYVRKFYAAAEPPASVEGRELESFSRKIVDGSAGELLRLEERTRHARAHIVVVGPHFLAWLLRWTSVIVGRVVDETTTVALMLGVDEFEVRPEHRASLLTFQQWKKLNGVSNSRRFAKSMLTEVSDILSKSERRRKKSDPTPTTESASSSPYLEAKRCESVKEMEARPKNLVLKEGDRAADLFLCTKGKDDRFPDPCVVNFSGKKFSHVVVPSFCLERLNDCCLVVKMTKELCGKVVSLGPKSRVSVAGVDGEERNRFVAEITVGPEEGHMLAPILFPAPSSSGGQAKPREDMTQEEREQEDRELEEIGDEVVKALAEASTDSDEGGDGAEQALYARPATLQERRQPPSASDDREQDAAMREVPPVTHVSRSAPGSAEKATKDEEDGETKKSTGYIPMMNRPLGVDSPSVSSLRRSCSSSAVYVPPSSLEAAAKGAPRAARKLFPPPKFESLVASAGASDSSDSEMRKMDWSSIGGVGGARMADEASRPQSRQEIIHSIRNGKKAEDAEEKKDSLVRPPVLPILPTGFTPPPLATVASSGSAVPSSAQDDPIPAARCPPDATLFEFCQGELIDLQEQFKKNLISLKDVEEKFDAWKKRPELTVAKDRRQDELDGMREEWTRLQALADARTTSESRVWGLLRGMMKVSAGGRRKTASGSSSVLSAGSGGGGGGGGGMGGSRSGGGSSTDDLSSGIVVTTSSSPPQAAGPPPLPSLPPPSVPKAPPAVSDFPDPHRFNNNDTEGDYDVPRKLSFEHHQLYESPPGPSSSRGGGDKAAGGGGKRVFLEEEGRKEQGRRRDDYVNVIVE